ncbi:MAG: DUF885 domain-containing protein [Acidimicrobiales bacterium]
MTESESKYQTPLDELVADRKHAFDNLANNWIAEELVADPVTATYLGADGDHGAIGDLSAAGIEQREKADRRWLDELTRFDDGLLDEQRRVDLALLVSGIRGRQIYSEWGQWRHDPAVYLDPIVYGIFSLFLNPLFPEAETAAYAESRLRQVPQVVAEAQRNLEVELANPIICQRGLGQCKAAATYFRQMLASEVTDAGWKQRLTDAGTEAAGAMESFAQFLTRLAEEAQGTYALGEDKYTRLLKEKEMLDYGAYELRKRGEAAWAEIDVDMTELAKQVDPTATTWRPVLEELNAQHPGTPEEMLASYTEWTAKARAFCAQNNLVTFPDDEKCIVEPSPAFQRPVLAVASYSQPPAFRPGRTGHFFVPWPPDGTPPEEIQKRLASNGYHSIPTVSVHEAYPGHHWHLSWAKSNPSRVRAFVHSSYFAEGWALYTEVMMREQGFFEDKRDELCHLDARIFRAARIIVDTGLHIGDLDFEGAVEIMRTKASLPEPVARAEVTRYCAWPTQAPSYLTGSLEIERMRAKYLEDKRGDLHSFHDALCATGCMPLGLAERSLFAG